MAIAADVLAGRRQHMAVMDVVWPVTALYAGPLAVAAYVDFGRSGPREHGRMKMPDRPMWQSTALAATHCGAGCMLGDVAADSALFLLGLGTLLGSALLTSYVVDFVVAYALGIVFQYLAIVPTKHLSPGRGIRAAVKAGTLSLAAFRVGMYAWMAVYQELIFHPRLGRTAWFTGS